MTTIEEFYDKLKVAVGQVVETHQGTPVLVTDLYLIARVLGDDDAVTTMVASTFERDIPMELGVIVNEALRVAGKAFTLPGGWVTEGEE